MHIDKIIKIYIKPNLKRKPNLKHLKNITTSIGIYQHCNFSVPNKKEGYCVDDNARALIAAVKIVKMYKDKEVIKLARIYLSFISYMQKRNGEFYNFLTSDLKFIENKIELGDHFGRVFWGLGYSIYYNIDKSITSKAKKIFENSIKSTSKIKFIRAQAFSLIGLCYFFRKNKRIYILKLIKLISRRILKKYYLNCDREWKWFENSLVYSNAIIPYSLFCAYKIVKDKKLLDVGLESLNFLIKVCQIKGKPSPIGFKGWYKKKGRKALYGQQAVDVFDMVIACKKAYLITKNKKYRSEMYRWFAWFYGYNAGSQIMYNKKTGGCFDGLNKNGVNPNQGAESLLSWLISYLEVKELYDYENSNT